MLGERATGGRLSLGSFREMCGLAPGLGSSMACFSFSWSLSAAAADPHRQSRRQDPLESDFIELFATGTRAGSRS